LRGSEEPGELKAKASHLYRAVDSPPSSMKCRVGRADHRLRAAISADALSAAAGATEPQSNPQQSISMPQAPASRCSHRVPCVIIPLSRSRIRTTSPITALASCTFRNIFRPPALSVPRLIRRLPRTLDQPSIDEGQFPSAVSQIDFLFIVAFILHRSLRGCRTCGAPGRSSRPAPTSPSRQMLHGAWEIYRGLPALSPASCGQGARS
jgi:hypothetical protein